MERTPLQRCAPSKASVALVCIAMLRASLLSADSNVADSMRTDSMRGQAPSAMEPEVFKNCIKFLGGPGFPDFKGKESWNNELTVSGEEAVCAFADKTLTPVSIALRDVTSIIYGQASSRKAGTWVAVGVILAPIALLGLLHKSRKHNVLISWNGENGQERGVYLEVRAKHMRRLLNTVSYRTEKVVYADEKDRKWLLTQGVQAKLDPSGTASQP